MPSHVSLVCCFNSKRQLLLGTRRDNSKYTLCGGGSNPGESPKETAIRETLEETGLVLTHLEFMMKTVIRNREIYVFRADVDGTPTSRLDPDAECSTWQWVDVKNGLPKQIVENLHGPPKDINILKEAVGYSNKNSDLSFIKSEKPVKPLNVPYQTLVPKHLAALGYSLSVRQDDEGQFLKLHAFIEHKSAGIMEVAAGIAREYEYGVAELDAIWNGNEVTLLTVNLPNPDHQGLGLPFLLVDALLEHLKKANKTIFYEIRSADPSSCNRQAVEQICTQKLFNYVGATPISYEIGPTNYLKQDDEIGRQLEIPNTYEKTMALKLDSVSEQHLEHALEYGLNQAVWQHPKFGSATLELFCKNKSLAEYWGRCVQHPQISDNHLSFLIPNIIGHPNELVLAAQIAESPKLGPDSAKRLIDMGVKQTMANPVVSASTGEAFTDWAKVSDLMPVNLLAQYYLLNPNCTPEYADQSISDGQPLYQELAVRLNGYFPYQWAIDQFIQGRIQNGNANVRMAILEHPKVPVKIVLTALKDRNELVANRAKELSLRLSGLAKSEGNDLDTFQAMLGYNGLLETWLQAAKVLAGGKSVSEDQISSAWAETEGNMVETALIAYCLPVTESNMKALAAIQGFLSPAKLPARGLEKSDTLSLVKDVTGSDPKTVELIKEAIQIGQCNPVSLGGKLYNGSWLAQTPEGQYLLKPNADAEVVFYQAAKQLGLGTLVPEASLINLNKKSFAAVKIPPNSFQRAGKVRSTSPTFVNWVFGDRLLNLKMAALDYIMGNGQRSQSNILIDGNKNILLINNAITSGHFEVSKAWFPYYLRSKHDGLMGSLDLSQKHALLGTLNPTDLIQFKIWLTGLDENTIMKLLEPFQNTKPIVDRLLQLKMAAYVYPADQVVNNAWLGILN